MSGKPTTSNDGRNNQLTVERDVPNSEVDEKLDAYFGDDTEDRKMHFVAGSVLNNSEKIKDVKKGIGLRDYLSVLFKNFVEIKVNRGKSAPTENKGSQNTVRRTQRDSTRKRSDTQRIPRNSKKTSKTADDERADK